MHNNHGLKMKFYLMLNFVFYKYVRDLKNASAINKHLRDFFIYAEGESPFIFGLTFITVMY